MAWRNSRAVAATSNSPMYYSKAKEEKSIIFTADILTCGWYLLVKILANFYKLVQNGPDTSANIRRFKCITDNSDPARILQIQMYQPVNNFENFVLWPVAPPTTDPPITESEMFRHPGCQLRAHWAANVSDRKVLSVLTRKWVVVIHNKVRNKGIDYGWI